MTTNTPRAASATYGSARSTAYADAPVASSFRSNVGLAHIGRRTLGISLLLLTVFLWTASNFMASYIFSDNTYSKPFFIVYINTSFFAISLVPMAIRFFRDNGISGTRRAAWEQWKGLQQDMREKVVWRAGRSSGEDDSPNKSLEDDDDDSGVLRRRRRNTASSRDGDGQGDGQEDEDEDEIVGDHNAAAAQRLLPDDANVEATSMIGHGADLEAALAAPTLTAAAAAAASSTGKLDFRETAWLSAEFCLLWFAANYFAVACLEYTSVASATIFTSLSSVFTLLFCAVVGVEGFSVRKLVGVVASVAGVGLISSVDLSGQGDENRGKFPHKSPGEIAIGDAMALLSAVVYGGYVTVMKLRVGNEDRVDMPLFFGLVGLINVLFLWPGFVLLHVIGIEKFELPPTGQVWLIIMLNSLSSFISDMAWAYAMLLTTPLVVTVGLSLTIPLSLVGEMVQYGQYSSATYWVGACMVVLSFLFVNNESHETEEEASG